jgi:hypothetical protein
MEPTNFYKDDEGVICVPGGKKMLSKYYLKSFAL